MMLAIQEILRGKIRFTLLSGAVGLLIFLILFQQALLSGLVTDFIGAIKNQSAEVLVLSEQARKNVEGSFVLPEQVAGVAAVAGVASAEPIGESTFTVEAGGTTTDAVVFGYRLGGLGAPSELSEGRYPTAPDEAVASSSDARNGFGIGDVVQIVGPGGPAITVVGLANNLRWSVTATLFASYDTFERAQAAANPGSRLVLPSLVAVQAEPGVDLNTLTDRIDSEVAGVEALTRDEAVSDNPGVQGVNQSFAIILGLAFLVVALVVGFFFLILTTQKAGALTLLRAVGAPTSYLVRNLVLQIVFVLAAGSLIGVALTVFVLGVAAPGDLTISVEPRTAALTLVGLAVLSMIGGLAAIRRVLRINPLQATTTVGRAT